MGIFSDGTAIADPVFQDEKFSFFARTNGPASAEHASVGK